MTVDSGGQELGTKIIHREIPKPTIDPARLDVKIYNASNISGGKVGKEKIAELSRQKATRVERLIGQDPQMYLDGNSAEEVVVDASGGLVVSGDLTPSSQEAILGNYLSTEIAISALYTSTPVIDSLPPDSFVIPESELARSIDASGILLTTVGAHEPNIRTRIYSIPGQQLDLQKKPIPREQQKVLLVQDVPAGDGKIRRIYTVSTQEVISDNLNDHGARIKEAQAKDQSGNGSQVDQGQVLAQGNEVALHMRYIGLLADNVLGGRTQPVALQNYVNHAIGNGVPRELIDLALQGKGIPIRRLSSSEVKTDPAENLRPIIDKLRTKFPDQPAGVGRLGIEVKLSPEEIRQIQDFLEQRRNELSANPDMQNIRRVVDQLRTENKAYQVKNFLGHGVEEDSALSQLVIEQTPSGPVVKLPPKLYKLWKSSVSVEVATQMLGSIGTSTASFANNLEGAI